MAAYKLDGAPEGFASNLDLFHTPPVNAGEFGREIIEYRPQTQLAKDAPIHFSISGTGGDYKDLSQTVLEVGVRIEATDGGAITDADKVTFCNLALHSLFRECEVSLNQKVISAGVDNNYSYKSYLDTIIRFRDTDPGGWIQAEGYYQDTSGFMNSLDPDSGENIGLLERHQLTNQGNYIQLVGPLRLDISRQERLLLNGVQMDVRLRPNSDAFALLYEWGQRNYTFRINKAVLYLTHVKPNPSLILAHAEVLKRQAAQYMIQKSLIRTYTIPAGSYNFEVDDLFQGNMPSRVLVGLVRSEAFNGNSQLNPYEFSDHDLSSLILYFDGIPKPHPLKMDYRNNQITQGYSSIFKASGKWGVGNQIISLQDYARGFCLYAFSLQEPSPYVRLLTKAQSRLSLKFDVPPDEPVTLIVYSMSPDIIQIDESRNVI